MIELVVLYMVGVFMGCILTRVLSRPVPVGTIHIDRSDEDGPYMFLELDESVNALSNKKYAYVEIRNENFLPHN